MPTLKVRNVGPEIVRRLRERAALHGVSVAAEHRDVLRLAIIEGAAAFVDQAAVLERLAVFGAPTAGRGAATGVALLAETRGARLAALTEGDAGG